jgi:membrane protein
MYSLGRERVGKKKGLPMAHETEEVKEILRLGGLSLPELAARVTKSVYQDNAIGQAAQLAYYFLFALFPFLLFLITLLGFLPLAMGEIMDLLANVMPDEVISLVRENVHDLVVRQRGELLSFGILTALWTSSSAVAAIMDNLNRAYGVQEGRPLWKVWGTALTLVLGLSVLLMVSIALLIFGPQLGGLIARHIGLGEAFAIGWNVVRWIVIIGFLIFAMANIYYFAPDVEQKWKWITPGSVFAILTWILVSLGFSYYVRHFNSYNKIYGSIGTFIVLLTWMYLMGFVILVGGAINAEIEHAARLGKDPGEKELPDDNEAAEGLRA